MLVRQSYDPIFDLFTPRAFKGERAVQHTRSFKPRVDVIENDEGYTLSAELPGFKREDIEIEIEKNVVKLSGKREKIESEGKEALSERTFGAFVRSFTFAQNLEAEEVIATFEDGVLKISLPLVQAEKARKIEIL